jgi:hypothetical protein
VLPVIQNVPGDERPAQRRDEPEGNERRHRQSSGYEREHADPGGEPSGADPTRLGWPGIVIGAGLMVGSAEFLGPNEERGWSLAGAAIPILYIAWSLWLLAMGIALIA